MTFVAKVIGPGERAGQLRCARQCYTPASNLFSDVRGLGPIDVINIRPRTSVEPGRLILVHDITDSQTPGPCYVCEV
jgi:hypothetical protein